MTKFDRLKDDISNLASLAGVNIVNGQLNIEPLEAPHKRPKSLSTKAVYMFFIGELCLKVGKVNKNSKARFTSQHYNPWSSNSNLSKSILGAKELLANKLDKQMSESVLGLDDGSVGTWIERNCDRINIYLDSELSKHFLSLLEAFLQCKYNPLFEGSRIGMSS
jgi:hypothetical protein